jgi:hypothetical protein
LIEVLAGSVVSHRPWKVVEPLPLIAAEKAIPVVSCAGPSWPNTTPPAAPNAALWTCRLVTLSLGFEVWAEPPRIGPKSSPVTVTL